jgi:hypothetical protein
MEQLMQRYFFHLNYSRNYIIDPDGSELPDLEAAKSEARQIARELAAEALKAKRLFTLHSIRICGEDGSLLGDVPSQEALTEVIPPQLFKPSPSDSHV